MAQIVRNVPDGGLDEPPGWEAVTAGVDGYPSLAAGFIGPIRVVSCSS